MKIKNEAGEEIEVFTSEEVEAKTKEATTQAVEAAKAEAIEQYKKENPDRSADITDLQTKLKEAEEALKAKDGDSNDPQVQRLRQERDDAKKALEDFQTDVDKKIDEKLGAIAGETKEEWLDKLSKGDAELRKKIEFEFDNYRAGANGRKDIAERMEKAVQLATGDKPEPGVFDFGGPSAGDRGEGEHGTDVDTSKYNDNEKAIGRVLGVTEADKEAYKKHQENQLELQKAGLIPPGQVMEPKK